MHGGRVLVAEENPSCYRRRCTIGGDALRGMQEAICVMRNWSNGCSERCQSLASPESTSRMETGSICMVHLHVEDAPCRIRLVNTPYADADVRCLAVMANVCY